MRLSSLAGSLVLCCLLALAFPLSLNAQEIIGNITPPDGSLEDVPWYRFEAVWSPDRTLFAVATSDAIRIYNESFQLTTTIESSIADFEWSPDSQQIAFVGSNDARDIYLWKRQADNTFLPNRILPSPLVDGNLRSSLALAWSPDGTRLATLSEGGVNEALTQVSIWETVNWTVVTQSEKLFILHARVPAISGGPKVIRLYWTPDNQYITVWGAATCADEFDPCLGMAYDGINVINATSGIIEAGTS